MKPYSFRLRLLICVVFITMCGCYTPNSVLKLATVTGANTSKLGSQLSSFADQETQIAKLRAANLAIMVGELSALDFQKARHFEAMHLAGEDSQLALCTNLISSSEKLAVLQDAITLKIEAQRNLLLSGQQQLTLPTKDLAALSKSLATLGQDLDFKSKLSFYMQYGKDVDQALQLQKQQMQTATTNIKAAQSSQKVSAQIK